MKELSGNFSNVRNVPGAPPSPRPNPAVQEGAESLFKSQLQALQNTMPTAAPSKGTPAALNIPDTKFPGLKFSNHAVDRMQARGVRFSPEEMGRIESAVGRAEAKGAKNTLLLTDTAAMIVSVKDKTVVTVMDKANLKENVFTNIDSTVMI